MLKQDFLLRQIESLAMSLSKLFFNKDMVQYEVSDQENISETDILYTKLGKLVSEGKINEAENLLFDEVDKSNIEYLRVGIDFYTNLNRLEDSVLEAHNYSREEIEQGLRYICTLFGYDFLVSN